VKNLIKFIEESELELVTEPCEVYGKPNEEKLAQYDVLAQKMAVKIKQ
jgi:effector-binding domain-containing protein